MRFDPSRLEGKGPLPSVQMRSTLNMDSEASAAAVDAKIAKLFPRMAPVSAKEMDAQIAAGALVVDVRDDAERSVGSVAGSVSLTEARTRIAALPATSRADIPVVCYCTVGLRSGAAAVVLANEFGLRRVVNYSVIKHVRSGRSLFTNGRETNAVHIFTDAYAALAPPSLRSTSFHPVIAVVRAAAWLPAVLRALFVQRFPRR